MSQNVISDYAILTLDEAADAVKIDKNGDYRNTLILFVNGLTAAIERYCARGFASRSYRDTFNGDGTNRRILRQKPEVSAITSDEVTYKKYGEAEAATVPDASVKFSTVGEVYLDDGYIFETGFQNCSIAYTQGAAAAPYDVKLAAVIWLKKEWKTYEKGYEKLATMSVADQSFTFKQEDIPAEAIKILKNYRVMNFG